MAEKTRNDQSCLGALKGAESALAVTSLTGRFVLVNTGYCRITGYTARELETRDFQSITHPHDLSGSVQLARRIVAGEVRSAVYETRYIRGDGSVVRVRNSVSLVRDSQGNPLNSITVTEDVTASRSVEGPAEANSMFHLLSMDLVRSEESEKRRIARELHDSTAQLLAGLSMNLKRLQTPRLDPPQRGRLLSEALDLAHQCSTEIRTLSYLLHPPLLEEFGLPTALENYAEGFRQRTGIEVQLEIAPDFGRLPPELEIAVFRIVQEGLTNIYKHSGSPLATVLLERDSGEVRLELLDCGRGIGGSLGSAPVGAGLSGMRERAEMAGGRFTISSSAVGTRIDVALPVGGLG